ncbi:hypothetical protein LTR91_003869 [Friedmanniomyces endolithicus]|uniref:BZIP domain-containing protein n=1 Tax=Friedmanniomyces endolithicus TaxID=329885 RepID=A0AAN6QZ75_9PEZI|nr:hypothetical protein LTR35_007323 [Friedmanniomyces endolithicus]KAK0297364.1 hypothetical protein LTS00_004086 [Friedmanniomyces endolithicus]KAK0323011.1 hypothetical protein LTR82_005940 [Friedmanniomyces endolithicus]KAK0995830.1 hypothetical protein LTS01_006526 [Friedmanniomyces endolithicus]KAK1005943.1 hypothetical protein LTR91_003869 [Friedmanniomyces endolithicus]
MSRRSDGQDLPQPSGGGHDRTQRPFSLSQHGQYGQPEAPSASIAPSPAPQRPQQGPGFGFELPPLPSVSSVGRLTFPPLTTPRLAGVSSILNPSHTDEYGMGRRRKASELESPRSLAPSLPALALSVQPASAAPGRPAAAASNTFGGPADRPARRVLTPRSPSLHRAASLNHLNPLSGTINAQQTPFPGSPKHRTYSIAPGMSGAPPLPTPPVVTRNIYGLPSGPTPSSEAARRAGLSSTRETRTTSGSASPATSYSSYSPARQTSPATRYTPITTGGMSYSSGSSSAPNTYQMMTLETTAGTVQLPVDVQAASRVADEKRARNAGASARFRARRKEKEKEASVTIGKLDQQVKELGEDADHYRRERDYLSGALLQTAGGERHFPRPPSPRRRRTSASGSGPSGTSGHESTARSPEHTRNVRRRTSTISLPQPPQPQTAMPPQATLFQTGYSMQPYGTPLAPQPTPQPQRTPGPQPSPSPLLRDALPLPTTLPSMQTAHPLGPPQLMQAPPTTGPYNPYAAERRPPGPPGPRESRQG